MIRPLILTVAVLLFAASSSSAGAAADANVGEYASAIAKTYAALERGDTELAKGMLSDNS